MFSAARKALTASLREPPLPQAGEVKEYSPLPLAGGEERSAGEGLHLLRRFCLDILWNQEASGLSGPEAGVDAAFLF
jgi:hypothetical protein